MWPQDWPLFPERASELAREVDSLFFTTLGITFVFSSLIFGLVGYFFIRYRRRDRFSVGVPTKTITWLEITWTIIPLVILLFMFTWGAMIFFQAARPPSDAKEYFVVGKQWMWKIQHPEGNKEINELHVPVGQAVKLTMTSEDVIHSFFVPELRMKRDVIPGRYTTMWFRPDKVGTYRLFCAEYCGAEHSLMMGRVVVMEAFDYEAWLAGGASVPAMAMSGEELFQAKACNTCHRENSAAQAPILVGIFGHEVKMTDGSTAVVDNEYLRESILNPAIKIVEGYNPVMPTYQGQLSEEEILALITYIKQLGGGGDEPEAAETAEAPADAGAVEGG